MKYIKRFNQIKNENNNSKIYESLSNEEIKVYNYILGLNESYDSPINESKLIDRLKSTAKKGLLTATLLASLMSNSTFASEYNKLSPEDKSEIKTLVVDKEVKQDDNVASYIDSTKSVTVNISNEFKSGAYKIDQSKFDEIFGKLDPIKKFIQSNKGSDLIITIESSESRVPNRDIETKEKLSEGELANRRFNTAKEIIENFLQKQNIENVSIVKDIKVGGPEYKNDDVNQEKYKDHQYIKITISINACQTCEQTSKLCNFEYDTNGKKAVAQDSYVGANFDFNVDDVQTKGDLVLEPGSIPDRAVIYVDGVQTADTGYFSDEPHQYKNFKYVPAYVLSLTKMKMENPNIDATQNMDIVNVKSVEELKNLMQVNMNYDVMKDKANLSEVNAPYKELIKMVENAGDKGLDVVIYKTTPQVIQYDVDGTDKKVEVKVYSPVEKTQFKVHTKCK